MSSTTTPSTNSMNIKDIALMQEIIRVCSIRGCFKPEEFNDIGTLNNKLTQLIKLAQSEESNEDKTKNESAGDNTPIPEDVSTK